MTFSLGPREVYQHTWSKWKYVSYWAILIIEPYVGEVGEDTNFAILNCPPWKFGRPSPAQSCLGVTSLDGSC